MISAFATRDAAMAAAAQRLADVLSQGIAARGQACAGLSGGATPMPAYERLAALPLPWPKITFALVDERFVPADAAASNEGAIRGALAPALAQGATLAPLYANMASAAQTADAADARYRALTFDIALMGMGEDGHTASWFPGASRAALDPNTERAVIAVHADNAPSARDRLTVTYPMIQRAHAVLLLITGEAKRAALERALRQSPEQAPVAALFLEGQPEVIWAP